MHNIIEIKIVKKDIFFVNYLYNLPTLQARMSQFVIFIF